MAEMANPRSIIDYYGTQGGPSIPRGNGLRPVGPIPAQAFPVTPYQPPPAIVDVTPPTQPTYRGRVLPSSPTIEMGGRSPAPALRPAGSVVGQPVPSAPVPALRPAGSMVGVAERGFTLGEASPPYADVSARPAPTNPGVRQIGYSPARVPGAGIEGMGDFAKGRAGEIRTVGGSGNGISLRGAAGKVGGALKGAVKTAFSPVGIATQGLSALAAVQSDATANDNILRGAGVSNDVTGASGETYPRVFGASGTGLDPSRAVTTNAISYRNRTPVVARDQVAPGLVNGNLMADAAVTAPTIPAAPGIDPRNNEAAFRASQEGAYTPDLEYGGNVGYFSMDGAAPTLTDIGVKGRGTTGLRNGVVKGQAANSSDLIGNIIGRQNSKIAVEQELAKIQEARANPPQATYKTAADFGGDGSNSTKDNLAARQAASYNRGLELQMKQAAVAQSAQMAGDELGLKRQELALKLSQAPGENAFREAMTANYRSLAKSTDAKAVSDVTLEKQRMVNEQKQKELEARNNSPLVKADAEYAASLSAATGLIPSEAATAVKTGYRTPQKAKSKWFGPDQEAGLVNDAGQLFNPAIPAGYTASGKFTPDGRAILLDANGKKFIQ